MSDAAVPQRSSGTSRARKVLAALLLALALAGCAPSSDTVIGGRFGPDEPVTLQNLTVQDGRYLVSYVLEVYVASQSGVVTLTCGVVDTTGRIAQLPGLVETVTSGEWIRLGAEDVFELPDLTMGIRCYPDREVSLEVVVRDAQLSAAPIG